MFIYFNMVASPNSNLATPDKQPTKAKVCCVVYL